LNCYCVELLDPAEKKKRDRTDIPREKGKKEPVATFGGAAPYEKKGGVRHASAEGGGKKEKKKKGVERHLRCPNAPEERGRLK